LLGLVLEVFEKGVAGLKVHIFSLLSADLSNNIGNFLYGSADLYTNARRRLVFWRR
jgi:hypothetical protein